MLRRVIEVKQYGGGNVEIDTELKLECGHSRWFIGGPEDWPGSPKAGEDIDCPHCGEEGKHNDKDGQR